MKNIQLTSLMIVLCALLSASCNKYLETPPDLRAEINTPEKVSELLTSAYPQANYIPFMEAMSDNAGDKGIAAGSGEPLNQDPWRFENVQSRNQDSPDYYWYACYKAIAAANRALYIIRSAQDGLDYSSQKGEALVARAYAHFMLVTIFAKAYDPLTALADPGIPYVTEPEEVVLKKYERKTVDYVYGQIEADLKEGLSLINDNAYKVPKFHFTAAAAHAFASRFYLFKRDYNQVVRHASLVFPLGEFASNLRPVNTPAYRALEYNNKMAEYTLSSNPANILLTEVPSTWNRNYGPFRFGLTNAILRQLFYNPNVTGGQFAYMVYGGTELVYNIPKFREHFVKTDINANFGIVYNILPLFSAEEVLLNRAEAYGMIGDNIHAIKDLNTFASKKIFVSQDNPVFDPQLHEITEDKLLDFYQNPDLQQCITLAALDFKRREYMHEGLRYLDILRLHLPVIHQTYDKKETILLGPNDLRRTLQLPQEVILSGVQPNPR